MYKLLVAFEMKPGTLEATLAAARPCIAATRKEPGCLGYDFYRAIDGSESMVAVEIFADEAAHEAHQDTPHFKAFFPILRANWASVKLETVNAK